MATNANLPNSCLVAILLVCNTRTGTGARILFHHPPNPLSEEVSPRKNKSVRPDILDNSTSSSEDDSSDEDEHFALPKVSKSTDGRSVWSRNNVNGDDEGSPTGTGSTHLASSKSSIHNTIFGLSEDGLVSLLSPDRAWHKRKFEMGINDLLFVGRPVFVRQDGSWSKGKKNKRRDPGPEQSESEAVTGSEDDEIVGEDEDVPTTYNDSTMAKSQLTMFHVVFVMNPPPLECNMRVKDMYEHVIKKFSRALKWEQVHHDYVWKQSEIMMSVQASSAAARSTRSTLSSEILAKSSLAVAMSTIYNAISNSRIASITLTPKVLLSLQIPPITSTAHLPSLTEPPIQPGLWLTTATDLGSAPDADGASPGSSLQLAKHYTLLLKSPPGRIARDVQEAGGELALPKFVSALRPTKSFYKLSVSSQIPLSQIQRFARHLIEWRRAVAIPPLNQRDTYIVSPNADMTKLRDSMRSYEQQFPPIVPSLPKMLSALSGVPRSFGFLIPNSDHKETYYWALAWLMRHGWVTQLRTFAYVRVDPSIKQAVRDADRIPHNRALSKPGTVDAETTKDSIRSTRQRPSLTSQNSSDGRISLDQRRFNYNHRMASLVLNPPRASAEESKWLARIRDSIATGTLPGLSLTEDDRAELETYWPSLVKYFNGRVAFETIPVRENLKRKFIQSLLEKLGLRPHHGGVDEDERDLRKLLVIFRHW